MKTFNVTVEMLQTKGACMSGLCDFLSQYPKDTCPQGVDYQELLDACAQHDRDDYAEWLLTAFGSIKATLKLECLNSEKSIYFAGSIIVEGAISCKKHIRAGSGIKAGSGIEAGEGIEAGWDFGIYAGLRLRISQKTQQALIKAKNHPQNIICGEFIQK